MLKKILSIAGRYGLALGAFALVLTLSITISRLTSFGLDLTSLIIAVMIASAWYLGRGPGLLVAIAFEITLNYFSTAPFTTRSGVIIFNRLILFVSLVLFASSRRNAEKRLIEQREWLRVALSSIGDAVIATDVKGSVIFINPTAEQLTGWTSAEAENKSLQEVFPIFNEDTREAVENPFTTIIREQNVIELTNHISLKTKDGKEIPIENSGAPIKDSEGKIIGVIVVFHDVSDRRRAARERERLLKSEQSARSEAESANRLKDEFLATVSHELRTPLNAILGWASMLQRGNLEEGMRRNAVEVIERNAKAQAEIISDILDVSRIITGKLRIESHPIELTKILETAIDTLKPAIEAKALELSVSLEQNNDLILGDGDRLLQIFWNLLSNAIKFTPQRGRIEISLKRINEHLEIKVSDNGAGIKPEFLPHVFERFRQAEYTAAWVWA
jgi:PAS domain S-box-containing protein